LSGKVGILLSGLGYDNGTQVLEVPFIYREIEKNGGAVVCLMPKGLTSSAGRGRVAARRNLIEECAPIIRGEVVAVEDADPKRLSGLIIPGGRGAITVLSNIAEAGSDARILRSVQDLIIGMHVRKKPIGTFGYGGALVAIALKRATDEPVITLGEDAALTASLSSLGIAPVNVGPQDVICDPDNRLFSAAGIGPDSSINKGADGVERLTQALMKFKENK